MGLLFFVVPMLASCTGGSGGEYAEQLLADLSLLADEAVYDDERLQQKIAMVTVDPKIFRDPREDDNTPLLRVTFEMDSQKMWFHMKKAYYLGSSNNEPCTFTLPLPGFDDHSTLTFSLAGLKSRGKSINGKLKLFLVDGDRKTALERSGTDGDGIPVKEWSDCTVQLPPHSDKSRLEVSFKSSSRHIEHCFMGIPRVFNRVSGDTSMPSVVFICVDAMRADAVQCVVPKYDITPAMDAVAREGVVFTRHFSVSNWTRPATIAMLASTQGSSTGINFYGFMVSSAEKKYFYRKSGVLPVNMLLKQKGFVTASIGNNAFMLDYSGIGVDLGFDELSEYQTQCEDTRDITGEVVSWLRENRHRNFFLFVNYNAPHSHYIPPPEYRKKTRGLEGGYHGWFNRYLGEVAYSDDHIGKVIETLKTLGLYDNTIIVITSDHGEVFHPQHSISPYTDRLAIFSHGQTQYDEELHTPLIIKPVKQKGPKNKKVKYQVRSIDIVPTLVEMLGMQVPENYSGTSLVPMMKGKLKKNLPLYSEGRKMYSVRIDGWKYAERFYGFGTRPWHWGGHLVNEYSELYNCREDPLELNNLAPRMPEKVREMREHLHRMRFKQPDNVIMAAGSDLSGSIFAPTGFIYDAEVTGNESVLSRVNRKLYRFRLKKGDRIVYQTIPADARTVLSTGRRTTVLTGEYLLPVHGYPASTFHLDPSQKMLQGVPPGEMLSLAEPGAAFWHVPVQGGIRQVAAENRISSEMHTLLKQWGYIQDGEKEPAQ